MVPPRRPAAPREPASVPGTDPVSHALFEALRGHRLTLAREQGLPPYVIASDRTLRELAELRPHTLDDLRLAHGIGPHKVDRYGAGLLAVVAQNAGASLRYRLLSTAPAGTPPSVALIGVVPGPGIAPSVHDGVPGRLLRCESAPSR